MDDGLGGEGGRDGSACSPLRSLAEPLDEGGAIGDLAGGFGERLALLRREDLREVFLVRDHQLEPPAQARGALLRRLRAPRRPSALGGFDRSTCFGRSHVGHLAELLTSRRIKYRQTLAGRRIQPLSVHIALLAEQLRILQRKCRQAGLGGGIHTDSYCGTEFYCKARYAGLLPARVMRCIMRRWPW